MDKAIYTVIMGDGYKLNEPIADNRDWEHICFTDQPINSKGWKIVRLADEGYGQAKMSRRVKIQCGRYLPDHSQSLYLDARFTVKINLNKFIDEIEWPQLAVMKHNKRNCLYAEARELGIEDSKQIKKYKAMRCPENVGLYAPGIMYRRHTLEVLELMEMWWDEVRRGSHRDQPSLAYCLWKNPIEFKALPWSTYERFMNRG